MSSTVGTIAVLVGVLCLGAAASMWSRVLQDRDDEVQGAVTDAAVVESNAGNAEDAVDVTFEYRYDGRSREGRDVIHPRSFDEAARRGDPAVPADYREGSTVAVEVPPERPDCGSLPDPGVRATYRVAVPAIAAVGIAATAVGAWLVL